MSDEWTGEVWQAGIMVAKVNGRQDDVMREVSHYCLMYGQDGNVDATVYPGTKRPKAPGVVSTWKAPKAGTA